LGTPLYYENDLKSPQGLISVEENEFWVKKNGPRGFFRLTAYAYSYECIFGIENQIHTNTIFLSQQIMPNPLSIPY